MDPKDFIHRAQRGGVGLLLVLGLAVSATPTLASDPTAPIVPSFTESAHIIANGPGDQNDPHVSGPVITFTSEPTASVHYKNSSAATSGGFFPAPGVTYALSDVSGNTIVFNRNGVGDKRIMFTTLTNGVASTPQELAPLSDGAVPLRQRAAIGGSAVAFEDIDLTGGASLPDISVADTSNPSAPAFRLTNDAYADRYPAVSPDGKLVVWVKSTATGSDIYKAIRNNDGTWTTYQITSEGGNESFPDTDGNIIVFGSDAGGVNDIYYYGTGYESELLLPGLQQNPNVSNGLIAFEGDPNNTGYNDIFAYDTQTSTYYQITNTPGVHERLNDISLGSDNIATLVWAAPTDATNGLDIYSASFRVDRGGPLYTTKALFDQSKSYKLGSVVPIRIQLFDAQGSNISSASLLPIATGLVQKDSAAASVVQDAGNSNPDSAFRYDSSLQGYVFNLSSKGLSVGTWDLQFSVPGDATKYDILFDLR